jgi:hypothetical protein
MTDDKGTIPTIFVMISNHQRNQSTPTTAKESRGECPLMSGAGADGKEWRGNVRSSTHPQLTLNFVTFLTAQIAIELGRSTKQTQQIGDISDINYGIELHTLDSSSSDHIPATDYH